MSSLSLDEAKTEDSRPGPLKISWITDFTLVCPDRDILVVRECLIRISKPLAAALEGDGDSNSLTIKWNSSGIAEVMRAIHVFSGDLPSLDLVMKNDHRVRIEQDIIEFCFIYDIEPLLTTLKTKSIVTIETTGSNGRWIEFFHRFKNADGTEPFQEQTNAMRLLAINNTKCINSYFSRKKHYNTEDVIADYEFIINGLIARLETTEEYAKIIPANRFRVKTEHVKNVALARTSDSKKD
jgi:hypothetical protein